MEGGGGTTRGAGPNQSPSWLQRELQEGEWEGEYPGREAPGFPGPQHILGFLLFTAFLWDCYSGELPVFVDSLQLGSQMLLES